MPNRILREGILTSPRVALLNCHEELFYYHLLSVVDDFGRYHANPMLLRAACYPQKLDKVSDRDIGKWIAALQAANLVTYYEVDGKPYLEMCDFRDRRRISKSKFPDGAHTTVECPSNDGHVTVTRRPESESESESETRVRAARLSPDWRLSTEQIEWAIGAQPTWDAEHALKVGETFRDYWLGIAGQRGVKLDWNATWRNWVRREGPAKHRMAKRLAV